MKKKKKLLYLGGTLVVLALAAYVVGNLLLGSIVTAGVNRFAPGITQTRVVLTGAALSPLSGTGTLSGLLVGNPKGWSSDKAFYLGKIHVKVVPSSIFGNHIVVENITIDDPEFVYETKFISSNIGDLIKNLEKSSSNGSSSGPTTKSGQPIKFEVRHFELKGGRVTLGVGPTALTLPMPPITLDNLGTAEGGITPDQLVLAVMRSVLTSVVGATTHAVTKVGSTMGAAAGSAVGKAGESLKSLFGGQH